MTKPVDLKQIRARHERCLSAGNQMDGLIVYDDRAALLSLVDTQAAEIKRLMSELEQVKAKLIASEAVIQTQIYGKYGIEHYSKITTELTAELEQVKAERDGYCNAVNEKYCDLHSFMELEGCPLCELEQVKANRDWWKSRVENGSNARHWPEFGPSGR